MLSFLLTWALNLEAKGKGALIAILLASLYAISDEFHQSLVLGRAASVGDLLADTAGATLVQLLRMVGPKF